MPTRAISGYAAIEVGGFYAQASAGVLAHAKFKRVGRASAYQQQAIGAAKANGWAASGEIGFAIPAGGFSLTPFAALDYSDLKLKGYTETGASVSNLTYLTRDFRKFTASLGARTGG